MQMSTPVTDGRLCSSVLLRLTANGSYELSFVSRTTAVRTRRVGALPRRVHATPGVVQPAAPLSQAPGAASLAASPSVEARTPVTAELHASSWSAPSSTG